MNTILLIEEIEPLRQYMTDVLAHTFMEPPVVLQAAGGVEGLRIFTADRPSMIILDAVMSEVSGLKCAQHIWEQQPNARILFWCHSHREAYLREAARLAPKDAVFGYILKSENAGKLKHALLSVFLHCNQYVDPKTRDSRYRLNGRDGHLTEPEYETLVDIMLGLTDRAIAARRNISVRGVQNRLASLLSKLMNKEHWALQKSAGMEIYNPRTRVIYEALKRGFITVDELLQFQNDLDDWLSTSINYRKHGNALATQQTPVLRVVPGEPLTARSL
jgi:DNA-binding NarL/FixJ family response regulator